MIEDQALSSVIQSTDESLIGPHDLNSGFPWSISVFTSQFKGGKFDEGDKPSRKIRNFYKKQDILIKSFEDIYEEDCNDVDFSAKMNEKLNKTRKRAILYSKSTLILNLILVAVKTYVFAISGSISVISSLLDSLIDLVSGAVMWISLKLVRKRDPMRYPQGRTRLEPVSTVVICAIMSVTSIELIARSVDRIVQYANGKGPVIEMSTQLIALMSVTIVLKLSLTIIGTLMKDSSIKAVVLDNRNDVFSNAFALIFGAMGANLSNYLDPIGAILVALFIIVVWLRLLISSIKSIVGHTADPHFIQLISFICLNHSPDIQYLESVRAFHIGTNHFVEVDIVLAETMELKMAHDIGESLQQRLERLPEIERAFVHLDYNFSHEPTTEHKIV